MSMTVKNKHPSVWQIKEAGMAMLGIEGADAQRSYESAFSAIFHCLRHHFAREAAVALAAHGEVDAISVVSSHFKSLHEGSI